MPKISVVMPAYNAEKYIAEAIESILAQTYKDFEFIIINDGSTDKTEEIILSYNVERIVYLKNEKNMGIVYTLNRGLEIAKGKFIARMDSDDISLPNRFEKQLSFLKTHKDIAVLGTSFTIFGEGIENYPFIFSSNSKRAKAELFFNSALGHPSVMIKKSVLDDNSLRYEEKYKGLEDFVLWWRIAKYGNIASLKEPLLKYRKHKKQITSSRDLAFEQKFKKFLLERVNVFDINYTNTEFDSLLKYCLSLYDDLIINDIKNLVSLFKKLLKANKKQKYFNRYYFKKVLGLAVTYSISFLNIGDNDKYKLRFYAFKNGVISTELFLKLTAHKILKH